MTDSKDLFCLGLDQSYEHLKNLGGVEVALGHTEHFKHLFRYVFQGAPISYGPRAPIYLNAAVAETKALTEGAKSVFGKYKRYLTILGRCEQQQHRTSETHSVHLAQQQAL